MVQTRTLVIGLDGACWEYLEQALPECPSLGRLIEAGAHGRLRSTLPPISPVAWSSFITGKRPNNHGIFDWQVREPGGGLVKPATAADRHGTPFWRYLNEAGLKTGIMGVPLTYPPDPVDGFLMPGFDAPWATRCCWHPDDLDAALRERCSGSELLFAPLEWLPDDGALLRYRSQYDRAATDACIHLAKTMALPCSIINYMTVDHLNHKVAGLDTVLAGLKALDAQVGRLLGAFPEANILVISDHGSSRVTAGFMIYELLEKLGYTGFKTGEVGQEHYMEILVRFLQGTLRLSGIGEKVLRRLLWYALKAMPKGAVERVMLALGRYDPRVFHLNWNVDAARSPVRLAGGFKSCAIPLYLDQEVMKEQGLDAEGIRAALKDRLSAVNHPSNGKKLFVDLREGGELFEGPYSRLAPDLMAIADPDFPDIGICLNYPLSKNARADGLFAFENEFYDYLAKGTHSYYGIYIFSGPAFARATGGPDMDLIDIPLFLFLLHGVPIPKDYEGTIRREVLGSDLKDGELTYQDSKDGDASAQGAELSDENAQEVMTRLRSLGYVD